MESDEELIAKYRNSFESHYIGELFQRYTHFVFGVCLKYLKNEAESQDAVMDIFEKILTDLRKHDVENFKAWLFFVAKNHCLMKLRKEKTVFSQKDGYEKFMIEIMESGSEEHLNNEPGPEMLEDLLNSSISYLKEEQKQCIELYYFENLSYKEIVNHTGYSIKQVKTFLQNGKRNLKIYLGNQQ